MNGKAATVASTDFIFESKNPAQDKSVLFDRLRIFAKDSGWSTSISNEVELILEEWISNVLKYALVVVQAPAIRVEFHTTAANAHIHLEDNGAPFDPTVYKEPDLTIPAERRPIGGLGIFMMKKLSQRMSYDRHGGWNRLNMEKDLQKPVLSSK